MKTLILAATLLALTTTAHAAPIKLGTEAAYAPFDFLDEAGHPAGFDIDVGDELCRRAGLQCTWVTNDWDTIIPNLVAGNYDAIVSAMSITDDRKAQVEFTQNYFPPDPSRFLVKAESTANFDNINGMKIGVQLNSPQSAYANANFKDGNTIMGYPDADATLAALNDGKVDSILADVDYIGDTVAGSDGKLKVAGPELPIGPGVGIGVRKDEADLKKKLDVAISQAKADGTLDRLISKWFPERGSGPFFSD